jgi:hypothetical protein
VRRHMDERRGVFLPRHGRRLRLCSAMSPVMPRMEQDARRPSSPLRRRRLWLDPGPSRPTLFKLVTASRQRLPVSTTPRCAMCSIASIIKLGSGLFKLVVCARAIRWRLRIVDVSSSLVGQNEVHPDHPRDGPSSNDRAM